jgi:hypothetical protein
MPKTLRIYDAAGWTMFVFGVLALLLGAVGLLRPEWTLSIMGLEVLTRSQRASTDFTLAFVTASSMASFNMGVYYVLAALGNFKAFYRWTVPFRGLTFTVFTIAVLSGLAPLRFLAVAIWELSGGIATGLALYLEQRQASLAQG